MRIFLSYCFDDEVLPQALNYYLCSQPEIETFFWREDGDPNDPAWRGRLQTELNESDAMVFVFGNPLGTTQTAEAEAALDLVEEGIGFKFVFVRWREREMDHEICDRFPPGCEVLVPEDWSERDADIDELAYDAAISIVQRRLEPVRDWREFYQIPYLLSKDDPIQVYDEDASQREKDPFQYEKWTIDDYVGGDGTAPWEIVSKGAPPRWPSVQRRDHTRQHIQNDEQLAGEVGRYRKPDECISVDARVSKLKREVEGQCSCGPVLEHGLQFPEAGPREWHVYPIQEDGPLDVAIIVSGGIAPGINSVINGIVERHELYANEHDYELKVEGCVGGLSELLSRGSASFRKLVSKPKVGKPTYGRDLSQEILRGSARLGGTILPTSRADELLDPDTRQAHVEDIVNALRGTDIVYVIGGDGSMRAAHCISREAQRQAKEHAETHPNSPAPPMSVAGVPKTTDNDILWVWQSFGFLSAVEKGRQETLNLHTEARSNPRLGVVQLFGSDSGFVVSHVALTSGVCDLALIPEVEFSMEKISGYMIGKLRDRYECTLYPKLPSGIVVMAETAIPMDFDRCRRDYDLGLTEDEIEAVEEFIGRGRRVWGQTPDELRSASLKIVWRVLQQDIKEEKYSNIYWHDFRVFTNEPRHLLRSIEPSMQDVNFGKRLGMLAVDNALAGYTDFMISQWLTEYVLVPLRLVILGRKRVPPDGIFWKSVVAATGQPADLT